MSKKYAVKFTMSTKYLWHYPWRKKRRRSVTQGQMLGGREAGRLGSGEARKRESTKKG
jgi:hypothetical protein